MLINYQKAMLTMLVSTTILCGCGQRQVKMDNEEISDFETLLVIVPHPDDEIIIGAGVIYDALKAGKTVKVVVTTNGDGYWDACQFWRDGIPQVNDTTQPGCSAEEMELFGQTRIAESAEALAVLGLERQHLTTLGYPDGMLSFFLQYHDSVFNGNTGRDISHTGKAFNYSGVMDDYLSLLRQHPHATILTTHLADNHADHAAVAEFIVQATEKLQQEEGLEYMIYQGMVHEPGTWDTGVWPRPSFDTTASGSYAENRESRYHPEARLAPPFLVTEACLSYEMDSILWASTNAQIALMRKAMDVFNTQMGHAAISGGQPEPEFDYWIDKNGYMISFVKRNHLFWKISN